MYMYMYMYISALQMMVINSPQKHVHVHVHVGSTQSHPPNRIIPYHRQESLLGDSGKRTGDLSGRGRGMGLPLSRWSRPIVTPIVKAPPLSNPVLPPPQGDGETSEREKKKQVEHSTQRLSLAAIMTTRLTLTMSML